MKKWILGLILLSSNSFAGLITHQDYVPGDVITAAKQNTNENAVFNEFNGNINSANIAANGVATANIADAAVTTAKLATVIQSSFTYYNTIAAYRRPNLIWVSPTAIQTNTNTSVANQTCVAFPDTVRCATSNTFTQLTVTQACIFNGTEQSGLSGATLATNTWYGIYAVKSNVNSANYVLCGSTNTPVQSNGAAINAMFGTNGWVYLGLIRNGDQSATNTGILQFSQTGDFTVLVSTYNGNTNVGQTTRQRGMLLAGNSNSLAPSTWTYTSGTTGAVLPPVIGNVNIQASVIGVSSGQIFLFFTANGAAELASYPDTGLTSVASVVNFWEPATAGVSSHNGSNNAYALDIGLAAWTDTSLGVGSQPQF